MRRRGSIAVLAVLTLGALGAGLWVARATAADPVVIGAPLELTGRFAAYGSPAKRGMEFALELYGGKVLGRPVQMQYVDVQSDPKATVSAFTDLLARRGVRFVVGPIGSPIVSTAIGVAKQHKPLWIVPGASTTTVEREVGGEPWFFHSYTYDYHYHRPMAAALKALLPPGAHTVAFLYDDGAYGTEHIKYARKPYTDAGLKIVLEEVVKAKGTDYTPALAKVKQANPDLLVGLVQTTDGILLAKQVREAGVKAKLLIATVYPALPEWVQAVGEAGEGWVGVSPYINGVAWPADAKYARLFPRTPEWEQLFRKRFDREPAFPDLLGYVGLAQLLIAFDEAGSTDEAKVAAALKKLKLTTPLGPLEYKPSGEGTLNQGFDTMLVFQRQGDKNVILYPTNVATGKLVFPIPGR
jgi:branched-chain amino acid transport system substrate-binding protein